MTNEEYNAIFDQLRQRIIHIPHECFIMRFRDVAEILYDFTESDDNTTECGLCRGTGRIPKPDTENDLIVIEEGVEDV